MSEEGRANAQFRIQKSGKEMEEDLKKLAVASNFQQSVDLLAHLAALINMRLAAEVDIAKNSGSEKDLQEIKGKISRIAQICLEEIHDSPTRFPRQVGFTSDGRPYRDPFTQTLQDGHG